MSLVEKDKGLSKSFLKIRVDYSSEMSGSCVVAYPGSFEFVLPCIRSNIRGTEIGRSPFDVVVPLGKRRWGNRGLGCGR